MARGTVINEGAFFRSLKNRGIAAAGIDVWYDYQPETIDDKKYPYSQETPFHSLDNVVLSPHRGASPFSDLDRWYEVVTNILKFARDEGSYLNIIDLEREY